MAGLPTQVLTKMISKVDSRLRDLMYLVELNLGGVVAEREACRLIVADGEGGHRSTVRHTMVIIKLDLDCIHFARQKFQRRVNEQCDRWTSKRGREGEREGRGRFPIIPIASDATKWEIPTLLLLPKNTMGMGRPVS